MAWLRNRGAEDAAAAAGVDHPEPVQLNLGRRTEMEVEIVCRRLKGEGYDLAWYLQSPTLGATFHSGLGGVDAFVLVSPADAEAVKAELLEAGLLDS